MNDFNNGLCEIVELVEKVLSERELFVIFKKSGFPNEKEATLEEIGQAMGVTRERIRQIESKGYKKLNLQSIRTEICLKYTLFFENNYPNFRKEGLEDCEDFKEPSYLTFAECFSLAEEEIFYKATAIYLLLTKNKARIKVSRKFKFIYNSNGVDETDAALSIMGLYKNVISL